eukprot:COSAG01_NODE_5652_length_4115_cov_51.959661_2_plen_196_part_00
MLSMWRVGGSDGAAGVLPATGPVTDEPARRRSLRSSCRHRRVEGGAYLARPGGRVVGLLDVSLHRRRLHRALDLPTRTPRARRTTPPEANTRGVDRHRDVTADIQPPVRNSEVAGLERAAEDGPGRHASPAGSPLSTRSDRRLVDPEGTGLRRQRPHERRVLQRGDRGSACAQATAAQQAGGDSLLYAIDVAGGG